MDIFAGFLRDKLRERIPQLISQEVARAIAQMVIVQLIESVRKQHGPHRWMIVEEIKMSAKECGFSD